MDRIRLLFALVILLSITSTVLLSNPETEIVQDSSVENQDSKSISAPFGRFNDQRKDSRPSLPSFRKSGPSWSQIAQRVFSTSRPYFRHRPINRPGLSTTSNNKTFIGIEKPVETSKPHEKPEKDKASRIPEISNPDKTTALPSLGAESEWDMETSEGKGEKVPPSPQTPQPVSILPSQNVPGNLGSTDTKRVYPQSYLSAGIINNFAFRLMESLNPKSNFVISPLSIFIALAMCYLGSDGNTKAQLEQALGMNESAVREEHLHQGIKDLMSLIPLQSSEFQLFVANGMFLGKNFSPDAPFMEDIQRYYAAEIDTLNFGDPQASLKVINEWVAKNTRDMIPKMLSNPPSPMTQLILLNAVYFKGTWKMQFPQNLTYNGWFHSLEGKEKTVPTMILRDQTFPFHQSDELRHTFIKLPYEGDQVSMVIALPYSQSDQPMLTTTDQQLRHALDSMMDTELGVVSLPKFRLEHCRSLKKPLAGIGIKDLFTNAANLSRLSKSDDLYVSRILHKAVVEVNEEGTEAAAVTEVRMIYLSFTYTPNFVASHPFAFYIVHEPSGLVLFHGKVFDFEDGTKPAEMCPE